MLSMNNFTFKSPTEFVFGRGVCDEVGEKLADEGYQRVLVVWGGGSVVRNGTLDRVKNSLEKAGLSHCELSGVRPNPELASVHEGIAIGRENNVDIVLAVGGGSVIDCSKAIALGIPYDGDVWDFYTKRAVATDHIDVACVLTIPAAGSEASNSCVISNDAEQRKCGYGTELNRPVISFMDPELTFTLPPYQTAAGVTDMICHIMERFFSGVGAVDVTDQLALGIIRATMKNARIVMEDPTNYEARANIMWSGMLAHNDLCGCGRGLNANRIGDWSSHALEHELSAYKTDITHGAGLAVIFPAWMRYVWTADPKRFLLFGKELFDITVEGDIDLDADNLAENEQVKAAVLKTIDALQDFFMSLGMPANLTELGIVEDDIEKLIPTLILNKGEKMGAFMVLDADDSRKIYASAL